MTMSRSNPSANSPNPSTRWFEWDGSNGGVRYYDKEAKENKSAGNNFTFLVLDELATVRGWHEASESGIYSNEVRDTKQDVMVVKSFKGGILAEGVYASIRDRIGNLGGHFSANIYIAYKASGNHLAIGALQLKGAALNAWVEFRKQSASKINSHAIMITGSKDGKKGSVKFKTPVFGAVQVSKERNDEALELDKQLQEYLKSYLSRPRIDASAPIASREELAKADAAFSDHTSMTASEIAEADREAERPAKEAEFVDDEIPF
jgi:hypothetical protein